MASPSRSLRTQRLSVGDALRLGFRSSVVEFILSCGLKSTRLSKCRLNNLLYSLAISGIEWMLRAVSGVWFVLHLFSLRWSVSTRRLFPLVLPRCYTLPNRLSCLGWVFVFVATPARSVGDREHETASFAVDRVLPVCDHAGFLGPQIGFSPSTALHFTCDSRSPSGLMGVV